MHAPDRMALTRILWAPERLALTLAGISLVMLVVHVTLDVLSARLLSAPIQHTLEISSFYYMIAIVFLPLATVERAGEHIGVDIVVKMLPRAARRGLDAITALAAGAMAGLFCYWTGLDAIRATATGETVLGTGFLPIWPARWILPIGFGLLAVSLIVRAWTGTEERTDEPGVQP